MMPRIPKYWFFQVVGWLCFALLNIYIAVINEELSRTVILINLVVSSIGFILSHLFRNYILRRKLVTMPTEKLLVIVTIAIMLLSFVYNVLYYVSLYIFYDGHFEIDFSSVLGTYVAVFFLFSVWSIIYFAWTYIENNRRNVIERLKMESSMKDLELKTIRSNLQPHFIFNSLNSIRALIDENPEQAREAITRISNILRNSITQQETTDTLENELRLVEDYLALEKIRFEERLIFSKDIAPATLPIKIPTMMLQTLVENAIKHGISALEQGGRIHIQSKFEHPILWLEIINTGKLQPSKKNENSLGFGLNSTRQRLHLIYNNNATFDMFENDNEVHVLLKIKTE